MKYYSSVIRFSPALLAVLAWGPLHLLAQEALRDSLAGEATAAARRQALEQAAGNLQLGRATFLAGAGFGVELNDNVDYSDQVRQEDVILRPGVNLAGLLPISQANALTASLDLSYAKYLKHSEYDRLLIAPGSQTGLDLYVKDIHFNLHDQLALTETPAAQGTISGTGIYNEFANTAGIGVDWDLNDVVASVTFDHNNAFSTTSAFSYLDRQSESLITRIAIQPSQSVTLGPEVSAGFTAYDQHVLSDSFNYSAGVFADWEATANLHLKPRIGYTEFLFDPVPGRASTPNSDSYYMELELSHHLNDIVDVSLAAGRQLLLGVNSELIDLWYVRPRVGWRLFEKIGLTTSMTFEQGHDSGYSLLVLEEDYSLLGGGINLQYQLMQKVALSLSYDYTVKDSNISFRSYHQNRVALQVQYSF